MNIGGINFSDQDLKLILGEKELVIVALSQLLNQANQKGFNMKLEKLPDGRIVLEPEGNESVIIEWVAQKMGSNAFRDQIQMFLKQRGDQMQYDSSIEISQDLAVMSEADRGRIIAEIKKKAEEARG